jgi:hypothetical protein
MRQLGRPKNNVTGFTLDLCRYAVLQPRIEEIKIASTRVPVQPRLQVLIDVGQTLVSAPIAIDISEQYHALQRSWSCCSWVGVPVNIASANGGPLWMARRPEKTAVDIDHQPMCSPEFAENLIEVRGLPDIPKRLGMMHRDDAVVLGRIAIPSRAVIEIGPEERRNLANSIVKGTFRNDVSYYHVAFRLESLPILVLDPLIDWQPQRAAHRRGLAPSSYRTTMSAVGRWLRYTLRQFSLNSLLGAESTPKYRSLSFRNAGTNAGIAALKGRSTGRLFRVAPVGAASDVY